MFFFVMILFSHWKKKLRKETAQAKLSDANKVSDHHGGQVGMYPFQQIGLSR